MDVWGNGIGTVRFASGPMGTTPEPRRTLAQAEARIAELEGMLKQERKNKNALLAVGTSVIRELEKIAPDHKLAKRANRDKLFDAYYKL